MSRVAVAEWRRLDREGTDRCELFQDTGGWRLSGRAPGRTRAVRAGAPRAVPEVACTKT